MDIEDLFKNKNKYKQKQYSNQPKYKSQGSHFNYSTIFSKINENKTLRNILIIAALIVLMIIIILIIVLFPLIMKLINFISENGLEGGLNAIIEFLNKIWSGSK